MERVKITSDVAVSESQCNDCTLTLHKIECTLGSHTYTGSYYTSTRNGKTVKGDYYIETKDGRKTYGYSPRLGRAVRKCR